MAEKKKIALLSNVTVDLVAARLCRQYEFYLPEGFDTWVRETIDSSSSLYSREQEAVIILLDGTEARSWKDRKEADERIFLWKQAITALLNRITEVPVFVSTVDIRENRIKSFAERKYAVELGNEWYQFLQNMAEEKTNLYIIDLADIIADIGRRQFYSNKMWYISNMPYGREGLTAVTKAIRRALDAAFGQRKKIIALDLDNTLWGGVIGEDGIDRIELDNHKEGQRYFDFQRQFLEMKNRGVVLAINSKNNEADAEHVIQNHPAMLLRDDDFVIKKINWENKAANLKAMEEELNLTESGFIFIDDNPAEREIVKGECSDALVPDFPTDTAELLPFAEELWLDYCCPLRVLSEDMNKTRMYQTEAKRKQEMAGSLNLDEYIAKLEMTADIHLMRADELERIAQLVSKTNQFNLTTKRYTKAEIAEIAENQQNAIYVVYAGDKYGDSGLISVLILLDEEEKARIDTFLMSCRVMGRKLEEVIINEIATQYKKELIGEFIQTAKNAPVKNLYDRLGFTLVSDDGNHKLYTLDAKTYEKKAFVCYKEIKFEGRPDED